MTITLHTISNLFGVESEVIFYQRELYKRSNQLRQDIEAGTVTAYDIFGNPIEKDLAVRQLLAMTDSPEDLSIPDAVYNNMEIGKGILALWREYIIVKSRELGITGKGLEQLAAFHLIIDALLAGMLWEASQMVLTIPTDDLVTDFIKTRFSQACLSADRLP